ELEITESTYLHDESRVIAQLEELRAIGVRISLDDFGTGWASLSYLRRLPVDVLKIDRSFVRDVAERSDDAALVAAIVSMAKALRLRVIAEGVEREEQRETLRRFGCDEMQGFLLSPAVPAEDAERFFP
ncbi:MAG TPA: EAL domain-containing protein, partial [Myxococcota bacterium]|nr:EAL domain-containing protein [Myxococcota bacterium]